MSYFIKKTAIATALLVVLPTYASQTTKKPIKPEVVPVLNEVPLQTPTPPAQLDGTSNQTTETSAETATEVAITSNETGGGDDIQSGEVVAGKTPSDESAIKSIQQNNISQTTSRGTYARIVNEATWKPDMKVNNAMTVKLQVLLDWNHASPGPISNGTKNYGDNTKKALRNFQKMHGIKLTKENIKKGDLMNEETWLALTKNIPKNQPVLIGYTITKEDVGARFGALPASAQERSKLKSLHYETIQEMLAERFHMSVEFLKEINKSSKFQVGDTIAVINPGKGSTDPITHLVANTKEKVLYAYNDKKIVATYPTTIGSVATATPNGSFKIVNKVKMPWYKATVDKDTDAPKTFMLPPGPNSPVGVVWLGLSKPSYGIHGSPVPEGISRQASLGCVRLTNWDVLEVFENVKVGATVEIK